MTMTRAAVSSANGAGSRFQVGPLLENLALTAQSLLRRAVVFQPAIAPDLPPLVTDQDKVKQILLNLLSNAFIHF